MCASFLALHDSLLGVLMQLRLDNIAFMLDLQQKLPNLKCVKITETIYVL